MPAKLRALVATLAALTFTLPGASALAQMAAQTQTGETGLMTIPTTETLEPGQFSLGAFGNTELEKGDHTHGRPITDRRVSYEENVFGAGILPGFELIVQVPFGPGSSSNGKPLSTIGDLRITPRYRIFDEHKGRIPFSLLFQASAIVGTGDRLSPAPIDREFMSSTYESWEWLLVADKDLFKLGGLPVSLTLNGGMIFVDRPPGFSEPLGPGLPAKSKQEFRVQQDLLGQKVVYQPAGEFAGGLKVPLYKDFLGQLDWLSELRVNTQIIKTLESPPVRLFEGTRYVMANGWSVGVGADIGLTTVVDPFRLIFGISYHGPTHWVVPSRTVEQVKIVERPVPAAPVQTIERIVFSDITFAFNSDRLSDVGIGRCYLVAQKLKLGKNIKVVIEGHTDYVGSKEYNQKLGQRRADAVKRQLAKFGVPAASMSTASFGMSRPLIDLKTDWARAVNRRTEFEVQAAQPPQAAPPSRPRPGPMELDSVGKSLAPL